MALKHLLALGMASLLVFGCSRENSANSDNQATSPTAETANSPAESLTQSPQAQTPAESESSTESSTIKSGTFRSGEHPTSGMANIVSRNGQRFLELDEAFKTSEMGPDLVVILHRSDDVLGSTEPPAYPLQEGDYVILAPLKAFTGTQSYPIPAEVNLDDYQSAVIWCRKFNATFGVAPLS